MRDLLDARKHPGLSFGSPWSNCYGVARSCIALGPMLTLLFTPLSDLLFGMKGSSLDRCVGPVRFGLFCLGGQHGAEVKQWVAIVVLGAVVSGWRPRITCLPHAYVAVSFFLNQSNGDGGDQISSIVSLLLLPVCLTDPRRWQWTVYEPVRCVRNPSGSFRADASTTAAVVGMCVIKLQISWIYVQSGISKLGQSFWVDGTAMYYFVRHGTFGASHWTRDTLYWVTSQPVLEAALTWAPIVIEVAVGVSLLLPRRFRALLLPPALLLHLMVAVVLGLWSFSVVMWGCLIFLLVPMGTQFRRLARPVTVSQPERRD
ncbi:hypothetical protein H7K45_28780 [Mycobacterium yunnanensis]|uniref:HTTM-like domain-containing protein n=1 Tax=Mycobacterium yunnanensis TaxID=368477 RepID=A0A9X2ZAN2_9MYCO|nr:sporulation-delaying protein SdpB family protein [Mycobacterium yunnanensis]MCV7424545.1 hypothetical protein [Mycobacterium yunnanensis]